MEDREKHLEREKAGMTYERVKESICIRQENIQLVLGFLKRKPSMSRTELARLTGMSPTSVTRIVSALMNQGLIQETIGDPRSGRGRKAANLRINGNGMYTVGVYLDRSVVRMCVMDFASQAVCQGEALVDGLCTPETMARAANDLMHRIAPGELLREGRIAGAGVCLPGTVNPWTGIVHQSSQMGWKEADVTGPFQRYLGIRVFAENDVKACLLGEKERMRMGDRLDVAYLLIGSGVGLAVTSGGRLIRGADNEAGEIAHIPLGKTSIRCTCGRSDCMNLHLVEGALLQRARAFDPSIHTIEAISWAVQQGRDWAVTLAEEFMQCLRMTISMIDCMYNPAKIIVGGSIFTKLSREISPILADPHVCLGDRYDESCMLGAALVAMQNVAAEQIARHVNVES